MNHKNTHSPTRPDRRSRKPRTAKGLTRSISFDPPVFAAMEERRRALRLDRSTFVRFVLEDHLGLVARPWLRETPSEGRTRWA